VLSRANSGKGFWQIGLANFVGRSEKSFVSGHNSDQATFHFEEWAPSISVGHIPENPQNTALLH
jgi:hypothetical protein